RWWSGGSTAFPNRISSVCCWKGLPTPPLPGTGPADSGSTPSAGGSPTIGTPTPGRREGSSDIHPGRVYNPSPNEEFAMPKYVIERDFSIGEERMPEVRRRSRQIIEEQFPTVTWLHSHVTVDSEGHVRSF